MIEQKELIHREDWDILLILDACRYDYFEKTYSKYLAGELIRVESEGSHTFEWAKRTFDKKFDCVYISANPHINSVRGLFEGFDPSECFSEVIDVWDSGWDNELKTVPPDVVRQVSKEVQNKYSEEKLVIHFMQPHYPYLMYKPIDNSFRDNIRELKGDSDEKSENRVWIRKILGKIMEKILGEYRTVQLRRFLGTKEKPSELYSKEKEFVKKHNSTFLEIGYVDNLLKVLKETSRIVDENANKKIIVTSDHGEFLGENELFGHFSYVNNPVLREVPWLEL